MSRKHSKSKQKPKPKPAKSWYKQQPKPVETINNSFGCVIKSWRSLSRQCTATSSDLQPTLVEIHGTYSTSLGRFTTFPHKTETPTSCPTAGEATLAVTGKCSPAFAYSSSVKITPYGTRGYFGTRGFSFRRIWTTKVCNINDPYAPAQKMWFCNVVGFEGRFYAMSLQGSVVVIEEEKNKAGSHRFGITRIGRNRAVPSEASRHFREYMFVLDGEILVVLLVSRESLDVVNDVEVFRLDIERLLWVKVGEIGNNRALILEDKQCSWAEASELGVKISNACEGEWAVLSKS